MSSICWIKEHTHAHFLVVTFFLVAVNLVNFKQSVLDYPLLICHKTIDTDDKNTPSVHPHLFLFLDVPPLVEVKQVFVSDA